jgi:hypothetical protein
MSSLVRLLTALAVLLMPFGMQPVAANAVHRDTVASMPMPHCPEAPNQQGKNGFAECMMVCSSAVPARAIVQPRPLLLSCAPEISGVTQILHGLQPETATPPPKHS